MTSLIWAKIGYSATERSGLNDVWFPVGARPTPVVRTMLAGCALLGVGLAQSSSPPSASPRLSSAAPDTGVAPLPPTDGAVAQSGDASPDATRFRPLVRIALHDVPERRIPAGQAAASALEQPIARVLDVPVTPLVPFVRPPIPVEPVGAPARTVDIEQISSVEGLAPLPSAGGPPDGAFAAAPLFADKLDAMQIPPFELTGTDAAVLMAEAPVEMTVRLGDEAIGQVALRMSAQRGIDVQLSGLLELVSDRFDAGEYQRLRGSSSADAFVPIDDLRAVGLNLSYDPVYDELQLSG